MTHKKTTPARKAFVRSVIKKAGPKKTYKIYRAVEKAIGMKAHKKKHKVHHKGHHRKHRKY